MEVPQENDREGVKAVLAQGEGDNTTGQGGTTGPHSFKNIQLVHDEDDICQA